MPHYTEEDLDRLQQKPRPKGKLPWAPEGRDLEQMRDWLTLAFRPREGWRFHVFERPTTDPGDGCSITFRNGRETYSYRFRRQSDLMGNRLRAMVLSVSKGELDMPHLTPGEAEDVWAVMCKLSVVLTDWDDRDETRKWAEQMLDDTVPLTGFTLVPDGRRDALMTIKGEGEFRYADARALVNATGRREDNYSVPLKRPMRFVDSQTGEQWLRLRETGTYLRWVLGAEPISAATLRGRLAEIGVEAKRFQDHRPPHPNAWLFRLTDELIEHVDGAAEEEAPE